MRDSHFGQIPDHWNVSTLGEVCQKRGGSIQTGPFGSQLHASDYVATGVPSIMPVNIGDNRVLRDGIACVSEEDASRLAQHRVRVGDIVYSRRGDVERRALVRRAQEGWLCGTGCLKVRVGAGVDPTFASYQLGLSATREWIVRHAIGATMPNLNTGIMNAVPFLVPPLSEQRAIATALSALDDKIELNRGVSTTLEAIARALFESWFVDFDPVRVRLDGREPIGLDASSAALFPTSFERCGSDQIPAGWRLGTLGEIAENQRRGVEPQAIGSDTAYIALEHMPKRCISLNWADSADVVSNKFAFRRGEILFGKLRPYFHKVGVAPVDGICSTDILVVAPKKPEWSGLVLAHLSSEALVQFTEMASTGTKMPRTNWNDISSFAIVIPPIDVGAAFTTIVGPMIEKIIANLHESRTLVSIRDTLLPKLLSGEIRLKT